MHKPVLSGIKGFSDGSVNGFDVEFNSEASTQAAESVDDAQSMTTALANDETMDKLEVYLPFLGAEEYERIKNNYHRAVAMMT